MNEYHLTDNEVQEYLDGTTPLSKFAEAHLEKCPTCISSVQAYRSLYEQIKSSDAQVIPDGFPDRVMEQVTVASAGKHKHAWFQSVSLAGAAAALACVALGIVALRLWAPQVLLQLFDYA